MNKDISVHGHQIVQSNPGFAVVTPVWIEPPILKCFEFEPIVAWLTIYRIVPNDFYQRPSGFTYPITFDGINDARIIMSPDGRFAVTTEDFNGLTEDELRQFLIEEWGEQNNEAKKRAEELAKQSA